MSWRNINSPRRYEKSIVKGVFGGGDAAGDAAAAQVKGTEMSVAENKRQYDLSRSDLEPWREAGASALGQQQALLGMGGQEAQTQAFNAFSNSPGQQYLRDQQEKALIRNASAMGNLGGGNTKTALQKQAFNIASTDYSNQYNRLAGLSGSGQSATNTTAQLGANAAANNGAAYQAGGQAQASGILGQQQANSAMSSQLMGAGIGAMMGTGGSAGMGALLGFMSDKRLKENIVKVGELASGLGWYVWDWKAEAKDLVLDQITEGVIAQEAQVLFPDAVAFDGEYLRVDYKRVA